MPYRRKHVKNKIYKLKPKKSFVKRRGFYYSLLIFVFISIILYFFLFSEIFEIKEIEISGNENIRSEALRDFAFSILPRKIIFAGNWKIDSKNAFLVDSDNLIKAVKNDFPGIEDLNINKKSFQTLAMEVKERKAVAAFCKNEECFLIDQGGIIFQELSRVSDGMTVIKNAQSTDKIAAGQMAVAGNIIKIILEIEKNLRDNLKINIKEAVISSPLRLDIKTEEKWQIYFKLESDIGPQITKINLLLNNEISQEARKNLKYIDLRFKDKAYYK